LGAILIAVIVAVFSVQAEQETTPPSLAQRFKGKVVMVILSGTDAQNGNSEALENVAIEKIGDRYFMTGDIHLRKSELESPKTSWREASSGGIALDTIDQYYVFSPEQYDKAMNSLTEALQE